MLELVVSPNVQINHWKKHFYQVIFKQTVLLHIDTSLFTNGLNTYCIACNITDHTVCTDVVLNFLIDNMSEF